MQHDYVITIAYCNGNRENNEYYSNIYPHKEENPDNKYPACIHVHVDVEITLHSQRCSVIHSHLKPFLKIFFGWSIPVEQRNHRNPIPTNKHKATQHNAAVKNLPPYFFFRLLL